jgi:DNA-binding MarR family transcriptional regulator
VLETLGERQQQLLLLLLNNKAGLTVDALSAQLQITRNAVRQHLAALERDGLVTRGDTKPSGGRPEQLYLLSDRGGELFPRRYSWFSELLIEAMASEIGRDAVGAKLEQMGRAVGHQLGSSEPAADLGGRVAAMGRSCRTGARRAWPSSGCADHRRQQLRIPSPGRQVPGGCRLDLGLTWRLRRCHRGSSGMHYGARRPYAASN